MKVKIIVELVIEADDVANAADVVDAVLDSGVFQAAINEWNPPLEGDVKVKSAIVSAADARRRALRRDSARRLRRVAS
jgi:hypothetical protein